MASRTERIYDYLSEKDKKIIEECATWSSSEDGSDNNVLEQNQDEGDDSDNSSQKDFNEEYSRVRLCLNSKFFQSSNFFT